MKLDDTRRNGSVAAWKLEPKENEMTILSSLGRLAAEYSAARARHLTERSIRSLPLELQKDIGWPEASETESGYRRGVGSWAGAK